MEEFGPFYSCHTGVLMNFMVFHWFALFVFNVIVFQCRPAHSAGEPIKDGLTVLTTEPNRRPETVIMAIDS